MSEPTNMVGLPAVPVEILVAAVFVFVGLVVWWRGWRHRFWRWYTYHEAWDEPFRHSQFVHDLVFAFGVVGALATVALTYHQTRVLNVQGQALLKQAETAEREHRDGRFEKGVDMLGSPVLTTRMGGIAALNRLATTHPAETHPEDYHLQVMESLSSFIRFPPEDEVQEGDQQNPVEQAPRPPKARPDVELAAQVIGKRRQGLDSDKLKELEEEKSTALTSVGRTSPTRTSPARVSPVCGASLKRSWMRPAPCKADRRC